MKPKFGVRNRANLRVRQGNNQAVNLLVILLISTFFILLVRRAWISDDAFITFRTVDNFIHGYRLTWNVTERVQAYTHPLWMLLLSVFYFFTREIYFTSLALSVGITITTLIIFARRFSHPAAVSLALVGLMLSKAFVDFSTSGLENPLSHLLILIFYLIFFSNLYGRRRLFLLFLVAALGMTTRMDLALVFLPGLVFTLWKNFSWKNLGWMVLGMVPFILWEIFSIFYYGFPFPNTAYAKLNTGIAIGEYTRQGLLYLLNSVQFDTVTPLLILAGLAAGLMNRDRRHLMLTIGCLLYLIYIVRVGGDFMSGRFLTVPLFCAVLLMARADFSQIDKTATLIGYGVLLAVGLNVVNPTVRINDLGPIDSGPIHQWDHGILDERLLYYGGTGLLNSPRSEPMPTFYWGVNGEQMRTTQRKVADNYGIGMFAYKAGPQVYVLDKLSLADPLLARLPAFREVDWRIGHFERMMPDGYLQTLEVEKNMIADPNLAAYYDKLMIITRGGLFNPERFVEIWKMNTGQYDALIDRDAYRFPGMVTVPSDELPGQGSHPEACGLGEAINLLGSGIEIILAEIVDDPWLEAGLDHNDRYLVEFYLGEEELGRQVINTAHLPDPGGVSTRVVKVPKNAENTGYDRLRIFPYAGEAPYCLGYLNLY